MFCIHRVQIYLNLVVSILASKLFCPYPPSFLPSCATEKRCTSIIFITNKSHFYVFFCRNSTAWILRPDTEKKRKIVRNENQRYPHNSAEINETSFRREITRGKRARYWPFPNSPTVLFSNNSVMSDPVEVFGKRFSNRIRAIRKCNAIKTRK